MLTSDVYKSEIKKPPVHRKRLAKKCGYFFKEVR